jgi:serine O-acetyltransferase
MRLTRFLLRFYKYIALRHLARQILFLLGADIPASVTIGTKFNLKHRGLGVVIHPHTEIGDDVAIFQGVTIGEAEVNDSPQPVGPIRISSRAIISAGAKVLAPQNGLTVGVGTVIAANAVLLESTGDWEVWGGIPARKIGNRLITNDLSKG